jgi:hypothetical protein
LDSREKKARLLAEERMKMKAGIDILMMQIQNSTIHHG